MQETLYAFDRKSARSFDSDGRMRVKDCILSTAEVNPYSGAQIPRWDQLGLKPGTVYELFRDPEELRKAVPTFEGIPLMVKHIVQTAEEPRKEYVGGSVHNVTFDGKHLRGDLLVWDGYAIELIESDALSDLSCGYRYDPVMQSGEADGSKFDGRMREIQGNHVALVDDGRATGAHVADAAFRNPQSPDPSMQQESNMPFPEEENKDAAGAPAPAAAPGSPEGEQNEQMNMAAIGQALKHIAGLLENIHGRLGGGAAAPAAGAMDTAGADEAHAPSGGIPPVNEGEKEANLRLTPAVEGEHEGAMDGENEGLPLPDNQEGTPARGGPTPHGAMDSKSVKLMVDNAVKQERARAALVEQAKRDVRGVLGDVIGMDSAGDIYREALRHRGVDVSRIAKGTEAVAWQSHVIAAGAAAGVRQHVAEHALDGKESAKLPAFMQHLSNISVKG